MLSVNARSVRIIWLLILFVTTGILVIGPCRYGYFSACSKCGRIRTTEARVLPLVGLPYWQTHQEEETSLSSTCSRLGLVTNHEHEWVFGHGGGSGMFGSGRALLQPSILKSPDVVRFVEHVANIDRNIAVKWAERFLEPSTSPEAEMAILAGGFRANKFESDEAFGKWWEDHQVDIEWAFHSLNEPGR